MAEALTWKSLIQASERLQRDVRRYQHEVERLSRDLRREQQETAKLREERERLRQIDVEFERPRQLQSPSSMRLPE
jgi:predicted RNase H-like nuclease (RuvC/YqgF family)